MPYEKCDTQKCVLNNHCSIHGTYLLSHRKRRISKKHSRIYREEHSKFSYKGPKIYLYKCYNDGFVVYSCKSYEGGTPIAYRDAIFFRKVQLASRKQFS